MTAFFAVTLFISAGLLFSIQPMFAKMVLPSLGGASAVWITSMFFFQITLLAGYVYAHISSSRFIKKSRLLVHALVLLLPAMVLPLALRGARVPPVSGQTVWLLGVLAVSIGLPFFALASTAPLLQRWFSQAGHAHSSDPYFLYRASNAGSILGLLSYPLLVEPRLSLDEQSRIWTLGYGVFAGLVIACSILVTKRVRRAEPSAKDHQPEYSPMPAVRRIRWVGLSFIPSSLLLGVTTYITTDIAAVPLLWVIPLALYLATFVLVFGSRSNRLHRAATWAFPFAILPLGAITVLGFRRPAAVVIPLHIITFFIAALVCHGTLSQDRPPPRHLTEFYIWIGIGGALGGVFNAFLSPQIFDQVFEYPLALILASFARPSPRPVPGPKLNNLDLLLPLALGVVIVAVVSLTATSGSSRFVVTAVLVGLAAVACLSFSDRPIRFGLGIAALLVAGIILAGTTSRVIYSERTFYSPYHVVDTNAGVRELISGSTIHGAQSRDEEARLEPLTYYHQTGPAGEFLREYSARLEKIALVGLGTGSLLCYSTDHQRWDIYEIDAVVFRIAENPDLFTFLEGCSKTRRSIIGDARVQLSRTERTYDLIIIDAFNSDAIPVHLITREALHIYGDRLSSKGMLLFHITNSFLDLEPVLGRLAVDAGLHGLKRDDLNVSLPGKSPSRWVALAKDESSLSLLQDNRWEPVSTEGARLWTDDFSNIFEVFNWR